MTVTARERSLRAVASRRQGERRRRRVLLVGLTAARNALRMERRVAWECYTLAPHKDTPAARDAMMPAERRHIERLDWALEKIRAALWILGVHR